jgi:hypothetical protein
MVTKFVFRSPTSLTFHGAQYLEECFSNMLIRRAIWLISPDTPSKRQDHLPARFSAGKVSSSRHT